MYQWQRLLVGVLVVCAMLGIVMGVRAQAINQVTLTGTLHVVWGLSENHDEHTIYMLSEPNGDTTRLAISAEVLAKSGGIDALNRRQVSVQVIQARGATQPLTPMTVQKISRIGSRVQSRVSGVKPWITVMCKFSDYAVEPKDYAYFNGMFGDTYPEFNHYWKELSYNTVSISGSAVAGTGWYTLPRTRAAYMVGGSLRFDLVSQDCAGLADSDVNFTNYSGINMMFNERFGSSAYGGSQTFTLDGRTDTWSATWMPPWGYEDVTVLAHEMGHGFGLPHSSGKYGETYDNVWDVMSESYWNCDAATHATYGCLGQHTIAYHKDKLGWIPSAQKYLAYGSATIVIDDLAMASTTNYRMAQIAINKRNTRFYTVEVRKLTGYDAKLPGFAVVIHEVDTTREIPAQVIDIDNDGDTSNAGAMWTTGETFSDAAIGLTVAVNAQTTNGYSVTISIPIPTPTPVPTDIPISTNAGRFVGWGRSTYGQITAPNSNADIVDISAGDDHTLVLRADGTVDAWGDNYYGQTDVPAGLTDVVAISAGHNHSLALKADGAVVGWGQNAYGEATPPTDLDNVIAISAGYWHSLALLGDGTVVGWGFDGYGETSPPATVENVVAISANKQISMAVLADGSVVAWGKIGTLAVPATLTNVVDIAVGNSHAVALHANGTVTTWGDNTYNQRNVPAGLTNVVEISTREHHTIARTANGGVAVWGRNNYSQLNVPAGLNGVLGVSAGSNHTVVFRDDSSPTWTSTPQPRTHTWTPKPSTRTATPKTPTRTTTPKPPNRTTAPKTPTRSTTATPVRPALFAKSGPMKNAINRPTRITLAWSASARAKSYEYCISTINPCSNWRSVGNARSVTVSNLQRNKIYYWHVRARNSTGVTNSADGVWRFTTVR